MLLKCLPKNLPQGEIPTLPFQLSLWCNRPFAYDMLFFCLRASREINSLLHLMLSDSSGSDGPPEADVQRHKPDEKPWNLDSLWYMSLKEHVADLQSLHHFWGGPGSARGRDAEGGWAAEPGEERSGIQCKKTVSHKLRLRKNAKWLGCLASLVCLPFLVSADWFVNSYQN